MTRLSVNVDHVATLRQVRLAPYPDPIEAARIAEASGADGITVHLRIDRRHIQESDVTLLRDAVTGKLNLEMSMAEEMVQFALESRPDQVTLVPESADELTTEGGLNLAAHATDLIAAAEELAGGGIAVSVFLDPDGDQIKLLADLSCPAIGGFEINTDRYSRAVRSESDLELMRIASCATLGASRGFAVLAGHGLTTANVGRIAALPEVEELNIGHAIVGQAVIAGMDTAVREMLAAIAAADTDSSNP